MSYWELYRADLDPLAQHYVAREHDAGCTCCWVRPNAAGGGWRLDLLRAVLDLAAGRGSGRHSGGRRTRRRKHASDSGVRARRVPAHRATSTCRTNGPPSWSAIV